MVTMEYMKSRVCGIYLHCICSCLQTLYTSPTWNLWTVDFHEFKYLWPDSIPVLTRQLITADILGDDSFIAFIASELKVPVGRLVSSNKAQNIKQVIRNRLKLWSIGVELKFSTHDKCFSCSGGFLDQELTNFVACCGRTAAASWTKRPALPVPVYCKCRMPEMSGEHLIECTNCKEWYHIDIYNAFLRPFALKQTKRSRGFVTNVVSSKSCFMLYL